MPAAADLRRRPPRRRVPSPQKDRPMRVPRAAVLLSAALGLVLATAAYSAHPPHDQPCTPCQPVTVTAPPAKVVVHLSPPEVVIQGAECAPKSCGSCRPCAQQAPSYTYSAPMAAPIMMAPT